MSDYDAPCEVIDDATLAATPFCIPGCWACVLSGDHDDCECDGSPNAIEMDRRWAAYQRLLGWRAKRAERDREAKAAALRDEGVGVLPNAVPFRPEHQSFMPATARYLRVVR